MRRALFLAALLAGCGVKAPPRPPEPERLQTTPPAQGASVPRPSPPADAGGEGEDARSARR